MSYELLLIVYIFVDIFRCYRIFLLVPEALIELSYVENICTADMGSNTLKYILNANTPEGFKYNYKYFEMQKYLNTNTLERVSNTLHFLDIY